MKMEEILMKHGFNPIEENLWIKGDWTIKIDDQFIEIFNNPDKAPGKYYIGPHDRVDLDEILQEIDDYLIKE